MMNDSDFLEWNGKISIVPDWWNSPVAAVLSEILADVRKYPNIMCIGVSDSFCRVCAFVSGQPDFYPTRLFGKPVIRQPQLEVDFEIYFPFGQPPLPFE